MSFQFKGGSSSSAGRGGGLYAGTSKEGTDTTSAPSTASTANAASTDASADASASNTVTGSNWSAALGFAPVPRRRGAASKPKASTQSAAMAIAAAAQPVLFPQASTSVATPGTSAGARETPSAFKPKVPLPPPDALEEEDINGFRKTAAGQKATAARNKKNKKKGRQQQDPSRDWMADYDAAKPNDYTEYKAYLTQKKAQKEEERRQKELQESVQAAAALAGDASDGDSDDSEERDRAFKAKAFQFAPPKSYDPEPTLNVPQEPLNQPFSSTVSGEDAYSQRIAMSQPPKAESGEDAYARRMAMSQQQNESGADAYARRLAMSQQVEQAAPPTISPSADQVSAAQPPLAAPEVAGVSEPEDRIAQAQARAKAIAEKLSKLGAAAPASNVAPASDPASTSSTPRSEGATLHQAPKRAREEDEGAPPDDGRRPNPQAFAERLMSKYGWKKGQGLGAAEDGVTKALRVKETSAPKSSQDKQGAEGSNTGGPVGRRGVIVSEHRDAKEKSEKEKYGEPSRYVCLTNLVGRSEVDDELSSEIAEEAQKYGIVQRCLVHVMPFNTPPEEEVRVIVIFSGMVGAWKAAKEFDGRYFNGRTVRARFFPEVWAERAIWGMQLD